MSYPNAYLRDFVPVLGQILKEKQIAPENERLFNCFFVKMSGIRPFSS